MQEDQVSRAMAALLEARRTVRRIETLPEGARPATVADGYRVQKAFIEAWAEPVVGWKVGATNEAAMQLFAIDTPFLGPIFSSGVHLSPVQLDHRAFHHYCIEAEFCLRIGHDLPIRPGGYGRAEIAEAVDAVVPAFELVSPRYEAIPKGNAPLAIADCGLNGALVIGEAVSDWRGIDLAAAPVELFVAGASVARGTGALALGHPLAALEFTVAELARHARHLRAGDLIATGTCTGVRFVAVGEELVADFGVLGRIEAKFV
ncbi:MAG: hypothetical protein GC150_09915 [Rhizobiales bacterium]|nr:hypothetical protein [Hyphomicrobiales bacterium]